MSNLYLAIFYSIISLFGSGLNNGIAKKYTKTIGPTKLIVYRNIFMVTALFIFLLLSIGSATFDIKYMIGAFLLSSFSYFGLFFFYKGLVIGKVGIVAPLSSSRIIISSLIGIILLNEVLTAWQFIIVCIIFIGTIIISINVGSIRQSAILDKKSGVNYAILAALVWGITFPFFSYFSQKLGVLLFALILESAVLFMSSMQTILSKEQIGANKKLVRRNLVGIILLGITGLIGSLFMNFGYETGQISITTAITGANPMVSTIYAMIVYKEKLCKQQTFAIFLIIGGIVALSLI